MTQYLTISSLGFAGLLVYIVSVYLYRNSELYSINWPGHENWDVSIRRAVNQSFKKYAWIGLSVNCIGVSTGIVFWKILNSGINTAVTLAAIICLGSTLLTICLFLVKVPAIVKSFRK